MDIAKGTILAFAVIGAVVGWSIHHSWWTPILGGAVGGGIIIGVFLWALSKTM